MQSLSFKGCWSRRPTNGRLPESAGAVTDLMARFRRAAPQLKDLALGRCQLPADLVQVARIAANMSALQELRLEPAGGATAPAAELRAQLARAKAVFPGMCVASS